MITLKYKFKKRIQKFLGIDEKKSEYKKKNKRIKEKFEKLEKRLDFLDKKIDINTGIAETFKYKVYRVIQEHFPEEIASLKLPSGMEAMNIVEVSPKHWGRVKKYIEKIKKETL